MIRLSATGRAWVRVGCRDALSGVLSITETAVIEGLRILAVRALCTPDQERRDKSGCTPATGILGRPSAAATRGTATGAHPKGSQWSGDELVNAGARSHSALPADA